MTVPKYMQYYIKKHYARVKYSPGTGDGPYIFLIPKAL